MLFRGKQIHQYTVSDIQSLIENKVPESTTLDYKREIKFDEKGKTEMMYDISSFYNTDGGCLIIGLEEEKDEFNKNTGIPKLPATKVTIANFDEVKLRIAELIKQSTNPQITNLSFSNLLTIDDSHVFLVGIPKTKTLPSMVTYSNQNRFYKRKSNGKYILDTVELYETFMQINVLEEKIGEFIKERQKIIAGSEFWTDIGTLPSVLIHIVPISHYSSQIENFSTYEFQDIIKKQLKVPGHQSFSYRYCLEGFHLYSNRRFNIPNEIIPYSLIFRNGVIESFTTEPFFTPPGNNAPYFQLEPFLRVLRDQLQAAHKTFTSLSIDFPIYLSVKLNNIKNMKIHDEKRGRFLGEKFDYDSVQLPTTLLANDTEEIKKQVKDSCDILLQAAGVNECPPDKFTAIFDSFNLVF